MYSLYLPYRQSTRWGFCTPDKKILIPCRYDRVWPFSGDTAVVEKEGKYGAINREGKLYVTFIHTSLREAEQEIYMVEEGILCVDSNDDDEGSCIGPPPEEGAILDCGGVAFLYCNGKCKTLDSGISTEAYESVSYHFYQSQQGRPIWVKLHGKWGVISSSGKQLIPFMYDDSEPFDEDYPEYSWVWLKGKMGIINYANVQYWEK